MMCKLLFTLWFFSSSIFAQYSDSELYVTVLSQHVHAGKVDYAKLRLDRRFSNYLFSLTLVDPDTIQTLNGKKAFWINVYNAYTLSVVRDHYPVKSIRDIDKGLLGTRVWDEPYVHVGGKKYSLNDVEHKILRPMQDPRIHFALVCAAQSCPVLRGEPYRADALDAQLDEAGRQFMNDPTRNKVDHTTKTMYLSSIFKWYGSDFGANEKEVVQYLLRYMSASDRDRLVSYRIAYLDYDWSLNE